MDKVGDTTVAVLTLLSTLDMGTAILMVVDDDGLPVARNCRHLSFAPGVVAESGKESG